MGSGLTMSNDDMMRRMYLMLSQWVKFGDGVVIPTTMSPVSKVDMFTSCRIPTVSLKVYFERLVRHIDKWHDGGDDTMGIRVAVVSMIYLCRIESTQLVMNEYNIHRLLMTAFLLASKFVDDDNVSNSFWSKVGGVRLVDANNMERAFCELMGYRLYVSHEKYREVFDYIKKMNI